MSVLCLMTGVLKSSVTETVVSDGWLEGLLSRGTVIFLPLPLAILVRTALASSSLPCTSSHRGDSGIHLARQARQFSLKIEEAAALLTSRLIEILFQEERL